jgi:hypothetical protein
MDRTRSFGIWNTCLANLTFDPTRFGAFWFRGKITFLLVFGR